MITGPYHKTELIMTGWRSDWSHRFAEFLCYQLSGPIDCPGPTGQPQERHAGTISIAKAFDFKQLSAQLSAE